MDWVVLAVGRRVAAVRRGVGNMQCPKCKTHQLNEKSFKKGSLILDRCEQCRGIWFDQGELNEVLKKKSAHYFEVPKIALENDNCRCPKCNVGLYEFCYPGTVVFIDMCKSCGGVWLDSKEWTEIDTARLERNKIICPKCEVKQGRSPTCGSCGIVFSKYGREESDRGKAGGKRRGSGDAPKSAVHSAYEKQKPEESYADNIPGLKGRLLRFVDRSISSLTDY